jgi:hypothetical protein
MEGESKNNYYYVDEAGDLTFFNKKKRIIIGQPGVSKFFMVGVAQIDNPDLLTQQLEYLRCRLLNDPKYKDIPSMQPQEAKTAIAFHAKDDFSDIRFKVFDILRNFNTKVYVVIKSKQELALSVQKKFLETGEKTLNQNKIYDDLVTRLFKDRLHKVDNNHVVFARRGKKLREEALTNALLKAKMNFEKKWNKTTSSKIYVKSAYPSEYIGLQVIDYYLWALQRLYEKKEDEFFKPIAHQYKLIIDLDDRRKNHYGEYYCKSNLLSLEKIDFDRG